MGFVAAGFFAIMLFIAAVWLTLFLVTQQRERSRWSAEEQAAERERLLHTLNAQLHCESCGLSFLGPIPEGGCPQCRCSAFVSAAAPLPGAPVTAVNSAEHVEPEHVEDEMLKVKQGA